MTVRALLPAVLALAACGEQPGTTSNATEAANAAPPAWAQCVACHSLARGRNLIGPSLAGVHGRAAGQEPSYAYSSAMRGSGIVWDDATLDAFLTDPTRVVPGTKMAFHGLEVPEERAELIAYLKDR